MDIWEYFPFIVIVALLSIAVLGYIQSWLRHVFAWIKVREDNYLAHNSVDSIHALIKFITYGLFILAIIVASALLDSELQAPFVYLGNYVFLFNGFVVLSFFVIMAIIGSSAIGNFRKSAEKDEGAILKPGILEFYELFIKYGMLLLGFFIAVMVSMITIPEGEVRDTIFSYIQSENLDTAKLGTDIFSLIIILLSVFLLSKFVEIILDDIKHRSKKFQPGIIDVLKAVIRYSLYWIAVILVLTIILEMIQFKQLDLVIIFIIALTITVIIIIGVSPATKNAISGIILLTTDSINQGDWVQIGDGQPGEVVSQGLVITSLKNRSGDIIDMPNELILQSKIHNYTKLGGTKVRLSLLLKSNLAIDKVEEMLLKAADGLDQSKTITSERANLYVSVSDIRIDSVEYTIGIWRKDPVTIDETVSKFLKRLHTAALENNITVIETKVRRN